MKMSNFLLIHALAKFIHKCMNHSIATFIDIMYKTYFISNTISGTEHGSKQCLALLTMMSRTQGLCKLCVPINKPWRFSLKMCPFKGIFYILCFDVSKRPS